jgi:hypothetical protein
MTSFFRKKPQPFSSLHTQAAKVQASVFDAASGKYVEGKPSRTLTPAESNQIAVDYFLKAGLDYKGQFQCCYETKGGGMQVDASIDPGKALFGVFSTEISIAAGVTLAKEVMLVAQRGPLAMPPLDVPSPIMINCLTGFKWDGGVQAGVEIAAGVSFSVSTSDEAKVEKTWDSPEEEEEEPAFQLENASLAFEAGIKAGFKAEGAYNYEHFYAEDVCPIPFYVSKSSESNDIAKKPREMLGKLFTEGSYKAIVKKEACDFINAHPVYFEKVRYEGYIFGHISSKDIVKVLKEGANKHGIADETKTKALLYIDNLQCWADANSKPSLSTFILISSHKADGKAGLFAEAGVSANAFGVASAEAGVSAEALTISGSYKQSNVRYQSVYYAPNKKWEKAHVILTQDSNIVYKQIVFTPAAVKAEATVSVLSKSKSAEAEKPFAEQEILNRMTYVTTSIYWTSSAKIFDRSRGFGSSSGKKSQHFISPTGLGTGISFGGSFELEHLWQFYQYYDGVMEEFLKPEVHQYFVEVANSLNVKLADLVGFFMALTENMQYGMIKDMAELDGISTVLLEATFRISEIEVGVVSTVDGEKELIELEKDAAKKVVTEANRSKTLESIRLRYRIQDAQNADSSFKLGFKIAGQGLGITLKSVDQAGSEGIVDLATVWIADDLKLLPLSAEAYEKAVPQVALFCQ